MLEHDAYILLNLIPGIGPARAASLISFFGSAAELFEHKPEELTAVRGISRELAEKICASVKNHSAYVQQLAWLVWTRTETEASEEIFKEAYQDLMEQNTPLFEKQTENLTSYQMNFLRAVLDGIRGEFGRQETINKYQLGSTANISAIKRSLVKKELIDVEKRQVYISDPVLEAWLRTI